MNSKRNGGRDRRGAAAVVPAAVAMILAMHGLSASGWGAPVKAATYHGLKIAPATDDSFEITLIFDT